MLETIIIVIEDITYHRLYECNGSYRKHIILGKLRVYHTVVLLVLEPNLVYKNLEERGSKYAVLRCRILPIDY